MLKTMFNAMRIFFWNTKQLFINDLFFTEESNNFTVVRTLKRNTHIMTVRLPAHYFR
jgi:hypothetical protein